MAKTDDGLQQLRQKIEWIDALVQEGVDAVEALAKGAQASIEHGSDIVMVHRILSEITERAQCLGNTVNCEAEEVGADHKADKKIELEALILRRWNVEAGGVK